MASALIKRGTPASIGRKERAKVVLPAPLGPAMMMIFLEAGLVTLLLCALCGFVRTKFVVGVAGGS